MTTTEETKAEYNRLYYLKNKNKIKIYYQKYNILKATKWREYRENILLKTSISFI
jgi:hypothetical protein